MRTLTKEELQEFVGKTVYVLNSDKGRIRHKDSAFFVATTEKALMDFAESIKDDFADKDYKYYAEEVLIDDLSRFNAMLVRGCSSVFKFVDLDACGLVETLYQCREEAIKKIEEIFTNSDDIYVPLTSDGQPYKIPVGNVQVSVSFFSKKEDAEAISGGSVGVHDIDRWMGEPPCPATIFSVDGEIIYGCEMEQGAENAWEEDEHYAELPVPEDNKLRDVIYELLDFCDYKNQLDEDDEDTEDPLGNTFFDGPIDEEEITNWEKENGISIPESYKEWLRFSKRANIDGSVAGFFPPKEFTSEYVPDDLVAVGGIIGDGEMVCFSKETGEIVTFFEGEINTRYGTFDKVLKEVIRLMGKREMEVHDQQVDRLERAITVLKARLEAAQGEDEKIELEYLIKGFEMDIKRAEIVHGIEWLEQCKVNYKKNTEGCRDAEDIEEQLAEIDESINEDKEELAKHDEELDKLYADNERLMRDRKRMSGR